MEHGRPKLQRCAIYTRKSSEEGLEQDFNSLHAQREASEAFIRSQAGEGWRLIKTAYDDGGFSGGTMERPALQRLLTDIRERLIDTVVVYKVDRLTRSLADFAKMVERFDEQGVSFVSVTQQFNTTTSMGRLTLNVLLSFAQFEREVTGERIRDKIAASKRKGMWMGGLAPLGYDVCERRLIVNPVEAETVRGIFRRYLTLGSVRQLQEELQRSGIVSKVRRARSGKPSGGKPFSRGALYALLSNPVYVGEIRHKRERHPGQHEPIVGRELWDQVHDRLRTRAARQGSEPSIKAASSPLARKVFDESGAPLYVQGATRGTRRYRYYVSKALVTGATKNAVRGWRVPAHELEQSVRTVAQQLLTDRTAIVAAVEAAGIDAHHLPSVFTAAHTWSERLGAASEEAAALVQLCERVDLTNDGLQVALRLPLPADQEHAQTTASTLALSRSIPLHLRKRGHEMRLVLDGLQPAGRVDHPLLKALGRAFRWSDDLLAGRVHSVAEIAKRERADIRYVRRVMQLRFLAPPIVEAIVAGRHPEDLTTVALTKHIELPALWSAQQQLLGIG